jgi:hypothetical protein
MYPQEKQYLLYSQIIFFLKVKENPAKSHKRCQKRKSKDICCTAQNDL